MNDHELLKRYVAHGDAAAFAELLRRYTDLVYSSALRQVRDHHQAEDVTQAVFVLLSNKAGAICEQAPLAAWLFKATHFVCCASRRSESRRCYHERKASSMRPESQDDRDAWTHLEPVIDEAIAGLAERDRTAVLLRFAQTRSMKEVGHALGLSEDAAQKRVTRALEKVRRRLAGKGVAVPAATLALLLTHNAVHAAPAQVMSAAAAAAGTAGAGTSGATAATSLAAEAAKSMTPAVPKAFALAVAAVLTGVIVTSVGVMTAWPRGARPTSVVTVPPPSSPPAPATVTPIVSTRPPAPLTLDLGDGVGLELVGIAPGSFFMGLARGPVRPININYAFYMGKHEVTQAQWRAVMKSNPARFADLGDDHPVEQVSWDQCQEFCRRASQQSGRRVRLPSESEWEYACRAGTTTDCFFGNNAADLPRYAWQGVTADGLRAQAWPADLPQPANWNFRNTETTQPVGRKLPNGWGLHDMIGNVYEWCQDERAAPGQRYAGSSNDGSPRVVAARGADRAARGGSWGSQYMNEMRGAHNIGRPAGTSRDDIGLRVVVEVLAVRG